MALLGGGVGGAGNPVGGSFTGPAEALEVIGNHAYAYSGTFGAATSSQTLLSFTSGNYYFVGKLTVNGGTEITTPGNGTVTSWTLSMNGQTIAVMLTETATEDMPATNSNDVIIPPYTEIEVASYSSSDDANSLTTAIMTGEIYRTRD